MSAVSPCVRSTCLKLDEDGNRPPIPEVMCLPCQNLLRQDLDWIVDEDFHTLKSFLPMPAQGSRPAVHRHGTQVSFGHHREDASWACTEIAELLNGIEARLRIHLRETPAPGLVRISGRSLVRTDESLLVDHAYTYLLGHFEQLCSWPEVNMHADALRDTHQTNRAVYGLTRRADPVDMPCPHCDVGGLVRDVGRVHASGAPPRVRIMCENCGAQDNEDSYWRLARMTAASMLAMYEAAKAERAAAST